MSLGPIMLDVPGVALTDDDRRRLAHPLVGGVILFARNYQSPVQLLALTTEIHALRTPHLLIAVDHEGGRVQRFREGFTVLPPMRELGRIWDRHPAEARRLARECGYVLAAELRAHGVDQSFTPVLDLDYGASGVIGDRAFHSDADAVADLAHQLMLGLRDAGMGSVGKHFPGHGFVRADSHREIPVDERSYADIEQADLVPFRRMAGYGMTGVMPAHVIYPAVDSRPAGWLLLLWPTLSALWVAARGFPGWHLLTVFTLGTILMRSAGCCLNDVADRDFDKHVKRTAQRPVTSGKVSVKEALMLGAVLALLAFCLVLTTNAATIAWSFAALPDD